MNTAPDFDRRFGGVGRLYGLAALERFKQAHVCVIGIGGVGSWVVEALARNAIGQITMIDLDNVAESNVNRQIHALDGEFGKAKVTAMAERIQAINPACQINEIDDFVESENLSTLITLDQFDWVIDCIDNCHTKAALIYYCRRNKQKLLTIGGAGGQIDPTRIKIADLSRTNYDPLLAKTRKLLRQNFHFPKKLKRRFNIPAVYSDERLLYPTEDGGSSILKPAGVVASGLNCAGGLGSAVCVTASFGLFAAGHILKKLANQSNIN